MFRNPPRAAATALLLLVSYAAAAVANPPIVLDGDFDDWRGVAPAISDRDDVPAAAPADIGEIQITSDEHWVYIGLGFGRRMNIQRLTAPLVLLFDSDNDAATGATRFGLAGVDLQVTFAPKSRRDATHGSGAELTVFDARGRARETDSGALDLLLAPTVAGPVVEFRLARHATGWSGFPGPAARLAATVLGPDDEPIDAAGPATASLVARGPAPPISTASLPPCPDDAARIVSWNVEFSAIFKHPEPFARVLRALDADVILFQELSNKDSAEKIASFLNGMVPAGPDATWNVVFGSRGGNLRCAVASRLESRPTQHLDAVQREDSRRDVRAAGMWVNIGGRPVLVVSTHLKCCGHIDSREDRDRMAEATALGAAITRELRPTPGAGVIVAGDLNLVGGSRPLETLARTSGRLTIVEPRQLDGASNATWQTASSSFLPGRLDYVLHHPRTIETVQTFVLDTADLGETALLAGELRMDDTTRASDHLPVVVDIRTK